jgi:hypothetical protein
MAVLRKSNLAEVRCGEYLSTGQFLKRASEIFQAFLKGAVGGRLGVGTERGCRRNINRAQW